MHIAGKMMRSIFDNKWINNRRYWWKTTKWAFPQNFLDLIHQKVSTDVHTVVSHVAGQLELQAIVWNEIVCSLKCASITCVSACVRARVFARVRRMNRLHIQPARLFAPRELLSRYRFCLTWDIHVCLLQKTHIAGKLMRPIFPQYINKKLSKSQKMRKNNKKHVC